MEATNSKSGDSPGLKVAQPVLRSKMIFHWEWIIVTAALLCDINSWGHQFVLDDVPYIVRNPLIQSPRHILQIFGSPFYHLPNVTPDLYRPLTALTLAINYWISGGQPDGFHLVNRLLHVLTCLGIFWVVRRLIPEPRTIAPFTSLLMAVHPIQSEAITYITGRSDALAMVFFIFSWFCFVRLRQSSKFQLGHYLLSVSLYFLALLSKESAITWLGIVLLTELVYFSKFNIRNFLGRLRYDFWKVYAGYFMVTLTYLVLRSVVFRGITITPANFVVNPLLVATFPARLLTPMKVLFQSIGMLVFPIHFSPDYSYNQIPLIDRGISLDALIILLLTIALLTLLVWSWKRSPHVFFGLSYFVITYSVVSNLVVLIGTIRADRLLYMPALGFCLLGGIGLARLEKVFNRAAWKSAFSVGMTVLLLFLGARTVMRNRDWKDEFTLFLQGIRYSPNSVKLHGLLGRQYLARNQIDLAMNEFRIALSIRPDLPDLLYDMGEVLVRAGKFDEAIDYYHRALALGVSDPEIVGIHLGLTLQARGDLRDAVQQFDAVIQESPTSASAHFYKANALYLMGRVPDAIDEYQRVLELNPTHKGARNNLNLLLQESTHKTGTPGDVSR